MGLPLTGRRAWSALVIRRRTFSLRVAIIVAGLITAWGVTQATLAARSAGVSDGLARSLEASRTTPGTPGASAVPEANSGSTRVATNDQWPGEPVWIRLARRHAFMHAGGGPRVLFGRLGRPSGFGYPGSQATRLSLRPVLRWFGVATSCRPDVAYARLTSSRSDAK